MLPLHVPLVSEVVQTVQLCADREQSDVVGDLSVCLDGMTVDPEIFATAEVDYHSESGVTEGPQADQRLLLLKCEVHQFLSNCVTLYYCFPSQSFQR